MRKRGELLVGLLASAGAVVFVTAAIAVLKQWVPVLSLGVLYIFAVLPVAVLWGLAARDCGLGREHARLQLVLPAADAHVPAARRRELGRARRLSRDSASSSARSPRRRGAAPSSRSCASARLPPVRPRARGGGAPPQRHAQDRAAARRVARPALAADGDPRGGVGPRQPRVRLARADRDDLVATIRAEAERLNRIVGNLLDLSRLQSGAAAPHQELWTADDLVSRALDELGPRGERIVTELDGDAPPVHTDAAQIERALVNLLDNALKFSPPTRRCASASSRATTSCCCTFTTRARASPAADRERVFEPFRRGDGSARGAGLGLAIARGFAEVNGARVWAENGGGGHFVLALPA